MGDYGAHEDDNPPERERVTPVDLNADATRMPTTLSSSVQRPVRMRASPSACITFRIRSEGDAATMDGLSVWPACRDIARGYLAASLLIVTQDAEVVMVVVPCSTGLARPSWTRPEWLRS